MTDGGRLSVIIELDFRSDVPIARQIADAITLRALGGALDEGSPLPDVRELALQLQVNPNTVEAAYDFLLSESVAELVSGTQNLVVARPPESTSAATREAFTRVMCALLDRARRAGLPADELRRIVEEAMEGVDDGG
ncbi:MAG: GntR family transcriptional regulator [Armatimonadia bacterium]|nr:GntR family transcriptional regulator [Armatimonadia bacterium]